MYMFDISIVMLEATDLENDNSTVRRSEQKNAGENRKRHLVRQSGEGHVEDVDRGWGRYGHESHHPNAELLCAHAL